MSQLNSPTLENPVTPSIEYPIDDGGYFEPPIVEPPIDATITLAVSPSSVLEDGTEPIVYTFTRSGYTANALTVNYGYNYGYANQSITFAANENTATLTIYPTADNIVESDETVALTLVAGTGYTVGTTETVTGTILDDDATITLAVKVMKL